MHAWASLLVVAASVCGGFGPGTVAGTIKPDGLDELSGLAASRSHPGVLWAHDDSGGDAALFALSESGADLGEYEVPGAENHDWEDMAAAGGYLYIGDIGDNDSERDAVTVYRVPEPAAAPDGDNEEFDGTETITLRYPTGPTDAESLLIDPVTGDLFIVAKRFGASAPVFTAPAAALVDGASITMTEVGTASVLLATAADVSPDGGTVLVRTYGSVRAFTRPAGGSIADALAGQPCDAPSMPEEQGEAIAFSAAGDAYVTASEGNHEPIHRFAAQAPTTTTTTTTEVAAPSTSDSDESDGGYEPWAVGAAIVASLLVFGLSVGWRQTRGWSGR